MRSSTPCTDTLSSRIESFTEFQHHFSENVFGQIPKEKTEGKISLLQPDDARQVLAESYRNIRSSIFFMPYERARPKTILITRPFDTGQPFLGALGSCLGAREIGDLLRGRNPKIRVVLQLIEKPSSSGLRHANTDKIRASYAILSHSHRESILADFGRCG